MWTWRIFEMAVLHYPMTQVCSRSLACTEECWHNVPLFQWRQIDKSDLGSDGLWLAHSNVPFQRGIRLYPKSTPQLKVLTMNKITMNNLHGQNRLFLPAVSTAQTRALYLTVTLLSILLKVSVQCFYIMSELYFWTLCLLYQYVYLNGRHSFPCIFIYK